MKRKAIPYKSYKREAARGKLKQDHTKLPKEKDNL